VRLLQSRMTLMKGQVLGPAFPKDTKFNKGDKLPAELENYIRAWRKSQAKAKEATTIHPFDLTHAPEVEADSLMSHLEGINAVQHALTCTALQWSHRSKNDPNLRNVLAGCCIQLDTVWCSRHSWLAEETIVAFRQEFRELLCGLQGQQQWDLWDGMLDIPVEKKVDRVTGKVIEEEVDMSGIDLEGRSEGEVAEIRRQVARSAKAKDACHALTEADLAVSQMEVAKRIWRLIQAAGVGTVNLGTKTAPAWAMTPKIKDTFEIAIQVSLLNGGLR
jgi:hypothetical protein